MAGKIMKTNIYIQYEGKDTVAQDLEKAVKEELKDVGVKQTSLTVLNIYKSLSKKAHYFNGGMNCGFKIFKRLSLS